MPIRMTNVTVKNCAVGFSFNGAIEAELNNVQAINCQTGFEVFGPPEALTPQERLGFLPETPLTEIANILRELEARKDRDTAPEVLTRAREWIATTTHMTTLGRGLWDLAHSPVLPTLLRALMG